MNKRTSHNLDLVMRRRSMKFAFLMTAFLFSLNIASAQSDSTTILTYHQYLENILSYHPVAQKANIKLEVAAAGILRAKGNLDPKVYADWNQKNFDDKLYYQKYRAKLKIPTALGIDVIGGYENTEGVYLNPESKTDDFGLWHLGVEVNVLQGLWVNERRLAMEQAKVFKNLADNERRVMLNDLIYNASAAYLLWQQYEFYKDVLTENVLLANKYLENTIESYLGGEKTAMDTLETSILYQDASVLLQKNEIGLIKSKQYVENYLWYNEGPISLHEDAKPEDYKSQIFPDRPVYEDISLAKHPIIMSSINKLTYLELAQKLKREKLKPKLKVKYNALLATSPNNLIPSYSTNDFKWGVDFSMPFLWRKERADVQMGQLKIKDSELEVQHKRNQLRNKIEASWLQQKLFRDQLFLLDQNVESYKKLLDGESEKFKYGESSVFLLNKRQEKYINGQLKLIENHVKQQIELLNFLYYSNQLVIE